MARYHISNDGEPRVCPAKVQCRLGDDTIHYPNKAEAVKGAEERFGKNISTTKSSSRKTSKPKPEFSVPDTIEIEGYMGSRGWMGGNLEKLQKESNNTYVDNKTIAKAVRQDIKNAIYSDYLPKEIDGNKLKYSVRTDSNTISVRAIIDGNKVENLVVVSGIDSIPPRPGRDDQPLTIVSGGEEQEKIEKEVREKLDKIVNSYRYDASNSMVDYFDTNFYPRTSVGYKDSYEKVDESVRKLDKELVDTVKDAIANDPNFKIELDGSNKVSDQDINSLIDRNPELRNSILNLSEEMNFEHLEREMNDRVYRENKYLNKLKSTYEPYNVSEQKITQELIQKDFAKKLANTHENNNDLRVLKDNLNMETLYFYNNNARRTIRNSFTRSLIRNKIAKKPKSLYSS